jgi:ABC-type sugar transport system substrate-binding protein
MKISIPILSFLALFTVVQAKKQVHIGYVMAGPDIYYRTSADVFIELSKKMDWEVSVTSSEYTATKEVANVEDFISKGVDAIVLVTANAEVGTKNAAKAKAAGIPLFMVSALPSKQGYDLPTGIVSGNWQLMGAQTGKYIAAKWKKPRIAMIEGAYGQGIAESIREGFLKSLQDAGAEATIVSKASGGWMRKGGLEAAQDIIAAQKEIDILYCQNEEMAAGALQAFKEAGKKGKVAVFSNNGKEMAWKWLKEGEIEATVANAPTGEGDLAFQMVNAYFSKKPFPRHVYMDMTLLTKGNLHAAVPWKIKDYFKKKQTGELKMDLFSREQVAAFTE